MWLRILQNKISKFLFLYIHSFLIFEIVLQTRVVPMWCGSCCI
nr:MAG TPA: hypothetical protein [Caudoviricetes sp.]